MGEGGFLTGTSRILIELRGLVPTVLSRTAINRQELGFHLMCRGLGQDCLTLLLFPGSGGKPWLAVGGLIARISKCVTRNTLYMM
jgi:hypothetical protein